MTNTNHKNIRAIAMDLLIEINENGVYSHRALRMVLEKYQYLEKRDRAFLTRLVEGTLERMIELDAILDRCSNVPVTKMKPLIRNLLRMSVYQIRYMDSVPDAAACNEAVKLAKKRGFAALSGYVNAVLHAVIRLMPDWSYPDEQEDPIAYLSLCYSMPRWILEEWVNRFGKAHTERILWEFQQEQPLTIRTNLTKCTPEELFARLTEEGVSVEKNQTLPYAFSIEGVDYLRRLSSFREGWFYVQDLSSMRVAELANPQPGDYIIDVCAAPGGKSTHLAEKLCLSEHQKTTGSRNLVEKFEPEERTKLTQNGNIFSENNRGFVEARDLTPEKVNQIKENIAREGLTNIKAVCMDALQPDEASVGKADILLCDLPCSGLGVLGQKKDIRYKMTPEKQQSLVQLQRQILDTVCAYVKPGGTLIYSTCTIHYDENEGNVAWFCEKHPEFTLESQEQLLPGKDCHDGFFMAKLTRQKKEYIAAVL